MKKLQMIAVLILTLLFVSACVPDEDDDEGFLNNDQTDTVSGGDSGIDSDTTNDTLPDDQQDTDSDTSDSTSDNADTANDPVDPTDPTGDPTTDPTDPTTDPTDPTADPTEPTVDPTEPTTEPTDPTTEPTEPTTEPTTDPSGLPECSSADITPCIDSSSTRIWSKKSPNKMSWESADSFCSNLSEEGFPKGSWRMPEIYELRTLIKDCDSTVSSPSSLCLISEDCLIYYSECDQNCSGCATDMSGKYSKLGDSDTLWSSSSLGGNDFYNIWVLYFSDASFDSAKKATAKFKVRCIKK